MAESNRREEAQKHQAALRRIRDRLEQRLPISCRVVMTDKAAQQWPKYKDIRGTIVDYEHGISPKVLWDGRKTAIGYHPDFIKRVGQ